MYAALTLTHAHLALSSRLSVPSCQVASESSYKRCGQALKPVSLAEAVAEAEAEASVAAAFKTAAAVAAADGDDECCQKDDEEEDDTVVCAELCRSLLVRAAFGGMQGDMAMLNAAAQAWSARKSDSASATAGAGRRRGCGRSG